RVWGPISLRLLLLSELCVTHFVFFFFSSRRRHTRLVSDWSSDVCSSDLTDLVPGELHGAPDREISVDRLDDVLRLPAPVGESGERSAHHPLGVRVELVHRSRDVVAPAAFAQLVEPWLGKPVRRELGAEVAA